VVKAIFDQGPPEIFQERPETGWGLVQRETVGKDAIEMCVGVDEAGGKGMAWHSESFIVRVKAAKLVVGGHGSNDVIGDTYAPMVARWLARTVD
jgi:hypothetical protein